MTFASSEQVTPSPSPAPTQTPSPQTAARIIRLPALPARGIAATWSRGNHTIGVSFLNLQGRVLATVRDAVLFEPNSSPGYVILKKSVSYGAVFYRLLPNMHLLHATPRTEVDHLLPATSPVDLPEPTGGAGSWLWAIASPDGQSILAQWQQQVSECQLPVAMIGGPVGMIPQPMTGDPLQRAGASFALGWTPASQPVVYVAQGPCVSIARLREGVYVFKGAGTPSPIPTPPWSYGYRMWGA
jgi:hypothetical protein